MTMPHLMNCGHSDDGHCLDCVKADWERHADELTAMRRQVALLAAECKLHREFRTRLSTYTLDYRSTSGEQPKDIERRLIGAYGRTRDATNADPGARAAVENANHAAQP